MATVNTTGTLYKKTTRYNADGDLVWTTSRIFVENGTPYRMEWETSESQTGFPLVTYHAPLAPSHIMNQPLTVILDNRYRWE